MRKPTRREAIRSVGSAALTLALAGNTKGKSCEIGGVVKLGVIADLHGGLAVDAEHRLNEFLRSMKSAKVDALVQLGDFAFPNAKHQRFADRLNNASDSVIHVIGSHEFDYGLKRNDCFKAWGSSSA